MSDFLWVVKWRLRQLWRLIRRKPLPELTWQVRPASYAKYVTSSLDKIEDRQESWPLTIDLSEEEIQTMLEDIASRQDERFDKWLMGLGQADE